MKLSRAIRQYVAMKHAMYIQFGHGIAVLHAFNKYSGDILLRSVAKSQVSGFLDQSPLSDVTWMLRYRILKAFFEFWRARDKLTQLPVPPSRRSRPARTFVPYIYSIPELRRLLRKIALRRRSNPDEFSADTFRLILLFLYGTGSRINEALSLRREDIDFQLGTVTFRKATPNRSRSVPLGPRLCHILREYDSHDAIQSDRKYFFSRNDGKPIRAVAISLSFKTLRRQVGISRPTDMFRQPRAQDLRWTFAVHTLRAWRRKRKDLRSLLGVLGAYLGHVDLKSTEAYLSVMPERFLTQLSRLSPTITFPNWEGGCCYRPGTGSLPSSRSS
jgi:integrase/recombinase XerD